MDSADTESYLSVERPAGPEGSGMASKVWGNPSLRGPEVQKRHSGERRDTEAS